MGRGLNRHAVRDMIAEHMPTNTEVNITAKITENRAVTDDSIRIYQENVDKARDSVVSAFKLKDSSLEILSVAFRDHTYGSLDVAPIEYRIMFKFGGVFERLDFELDYEEQRKLKVNHPDIYDGELFKLILSKVSTVITKRLLRNMDLIPLGFKSNHDLSGLK